MQAALWRVDKDEGRVALELEVLERLNNLKAELNGDSEKRAQLEVEQHEKNLSYKQKWSEDKCRVDGKWVKKSDCIKVPRKDGIGWKWALKQSNLVAIPSCMVGTVEPTEAPDGLHRMRGE